VCLIPEQRAALLGESRADAAARALACEANVGTSRHE